MKTHETDRSLHSPAVRAPNGSFGSSRNPCGEGTRDETRTERRRGTSEVLSDRPDVIRVESLAIPLITPLEKRDNVITKIGIKKLSGMLSLLGCVH